MMKKLNIGCGYNKINGYVNIDVDPACSPDILIVNNDLSIFEDGEFDEVLATDVLEHISHKYTMHALLEWARILKLGGRLKLQTSLVYGVVDIMRNCPKFATEFNFMRCLFGNQEHPGDFHHNAFTERTLAAYLHAAGFSVHGFCIKDQWLISCDVEKVADWRALLAADVGDEEFVKRSYISVLHRFPAEELHTYVAQLQAGRSRDDLLRTLVASPENLYNIGASMDVRFSSISIP